MYWGSVPHSPLQRAALLATFTTLVMMSLIGVAGAQTGSGVRFLQLRNDAGTVKVGDVPMILSTYDASGHPVGGLSGNFNMTIIDASPIPRSLDPFSPTLGVQVERDKAAVSVSMRVRKADELFIDDNGLAFPETAKLGERISTTRPVADGGPFINLTFLNSSRKVVSLSALDIKISDGTGQPLGAVNQDYEIILVKSVQRAPLHVALTDRRSGQNWAVDIYPMYRSSEPNLILYSIQNVPIGTVLDTDPRYEDKIEMSSTAKADQAKCEANDFKACNSLAVAFFKGVGVSRDATEGVRLYNKACTGGNGLACSNLAGVYAVGDGVKQDYGQAIQFFGKGCDLDDGTSCYNLGAMYLNGYGVKANATEGSRLMTKACKLGIQQACALK